MRKFYDEGGRAISEWPITVNSQGVELEREDHSVFVALGNGAASAISSPLAEILHSVTFRLLHHNYKQHIEDAWIAAGKPSSMPDKQLKEIVEEDARRNEGVVHTLVNGFLYERTDRFGLTTQDVKDHRRKYAERPHFKYLDPMDKIREARGPIELFSTYILDPDSLFQ
ncbi:MAG: hypothetical protein CMH61_02660 [Nanoarchaeota archaeon]|nr:hypothetical protein [Nanoarchaeota archaeon]